MEGGGDSGVHGNIKQEVIDKDFGDDLPGPAEETPGSLQNDAKSQRTSPTTAATSSDIPGSSAFQIVHNLDYNVETADAEEAYLEREDSEHAGHLNHPTSIISVSVIKEETTDDGYELSCNFPSSENADEFIVEINRDEKHENDDIHEEYPVDEHDRSKDDEGIPAHSSVNLSQDGEIASSSGICVKAENVDSSYDISYGCTSTGKVSEDHYQDNSRVLFKNERIDSDYNVSPSGMEGLSESLDTESEMTCKNEDAYTESEMTCKNEDAYSDKDAHDDLDDDAHQRRSPRIENRRLDYNELDSERRSPRIGNRRLDYNEMDSERRSPRIRNRRLDYNEFDSDSGDEDITVTLDKSIVDRAKSKFEVYLDRDSNVHSESDHDDIDTETVEGSDGAMYADVNTNQPCATDNEHHNDTMVEQYAIYNPERSEMVGIKSINPKQCFVCKKTFQYEFHKMYHMQQIHPEYLVKDRRQTLKARKQTAKLGVNLRGRYSKCCFICRNKTYTHPYYLNIHMQKMHTEWLIHSNMIQDMGTVRPDGTEPSTPFDFHNKKVCPVCKDSFIHAFQLKYHIQRDHAEILVGDTKIGEKDLNSVAPTTDTTAMFRKEAVKPTVSASGMGGIKLTYTLRDLISIKKEMDKEKLAKESIEAERQAYITELKNSIARKRKIHNDDLESVIPRKRKSEQACGDGIYPELSESEHGESPGNMIEGEGQGEFVVKRKRGRPKKILDVDGETPKVKNKRGRPKKILNVDSEIPTVKKKRGRPKKKVFDVDIATLTGKRGPGRMKKNVNLTTSDYPMKITPVPDNVPDHSDTPRIPDIDDFSGPALDTSVNFNTEDINIDEPVIKVEPQSPCNEDNPTMDMESPGNPASSSTKNVEAMIHAASDSFEDRASGADAMPLIEEEDNALEDNSESSALPSVSLNVGGEMLEHNTRLEVNLNLEVESSSNDSVQNHDIHNEKDEECTELEKTPIDINIKKEMTDSSHECPEAAESPPASISSRPKRLRKKKEMTDMIPTPGWPTKFEKDVRMKKLKALTETVWPPAKSKSTNDDKVSTDLDPTKSVYCGQCGKLFINQSLFKQHESMCKKSLLEPVSPKGYYPCKQCGKVFKHVAAHQLHILRDHLDIRHSCPFCGKLFAYQSIMKKHMVIHANEAVKKAISALAEPSSTSEDASKDPDSDLMDRIAKLPEMEGLKFHNGGVDILIPFENRKKSLDTTKALPDVLSSNDQTTSKSDDEDVSVAEIVVGNPNPENRGKPTFSVLKQQLMSSEVKSTAMSTQAMVPLPQSYGSDHMNAFVRSSGKSYSCKTCDENFSSIPLLYMHELQKHPKHTCPYCSKMFAYDGLLKKHLVVHMEEEKFTCIWCGKAYFFLTNFTTHIIQHNGNNSNHRLNCNKCGMEWYDNEGRLSNAVKDDIAEHLQQCMSEEQEVNDMLKTCLTHGHKNKSQRCLKCQKCYVLNAEHSRNVKISHILRCKMCNQTFQDLKELKRDLQRHHTAAEDIVPNYRADRSFNCGSCSEKFNCLFEFMCHMSAHKRTFHVKTEAVDAAP